VVPVLVSGAIFVKEGIELGAGIISFAVWIAFIVCVVVAGGALAGLACLFMSARYRRFARPSRTVVASSLSIASLVLFPVRASWDTVEGPDSASGLAAAADAALLKADLVDHATLWYTETCCG
jgi:hypothetical protein